MWVTSPEPRPACGTVLEMERLDTVAGEASGAPWVREQCWVVVVVVFHGAVTTSLHAHIGA